MAARVQREHSYAADVAEVSAMLQDPTFREEVLAAMHVTRGSVRRDGDYLRIEQVQVARGIPSFARKFVGEHIVIVQEERWTVPSRRDVTGSIPGKPGAMSGTASLAGLGDVTVETVEMSVEVSLPLVGGKIEGVIADLLGKALDKEHEVGQAWLARGGR